MVTSASAKSVCVCVCLSKWNTQVSYQHSNQNHGTLNAHKTEGEYSFFPNLPSLFLLFPSWSWSEVAHANMTHTFSRFLAHTHTHTHANRKPLQTYKCLSLSIKTHRGLWDGQGGRPTHRRLRSTATQGSTLSVYISSFISTFITSSPMHIWKYNKVRKTVSI